MSERLAKMNKTRVICVGRHMHRVHTYNERIVFEPIIQCIDAAIMLNGNGIDFHLKQVMSAYEPANERISWEKAVTVTNGF